MTGDYISRFLSADTCKSTCDLAMLLICLDNDDQIIDEAVAAALDGSTP